MSKTPIFMTGASGLVGSRFVELYQDQFEIHNLDLTTGVDITQLDSIEKFMNSREGGVLIHLAAYTNTTEAEKQKGNKSGICYQVNVDGTRNIAEACLNHNIYLIHISTDFVFDGKSSEPYTEESPICPLDWYGETKALAEQIVINSGCLYSILRLSYPYRQDFDQKPDIIKKIRLGLESGTLPPQFSDTLITPVFVDDVARAFATVISLRPNGIYHIVGDTTLSPYALAQKVATKLGYDPNLVKEGSLTSYLQSDFKPLARYSRVSNAKAKQELGLTFADIDRGLSAIIKT